MGKTAFIFPGQGAQCVGMGQEVIQNFEESKVVFDEAASVLDFDLAKVCFEENDQIHQTEYTQPALLAVSVALLKAVESIGVKPDVVAGLSLGEYSALVANGAMEFKEAVTLVRKRGMYMEQAAKNTKGSMAAVLRATKEAIHAVIEKVNGVLEIANYNNSQQIVISGEVMALESSYRHFDEMGIKVVPLTVSGAFHSSLMSEASHKMEEELQGVAFKDFTVPYVSNVTAGYVHNKGEVAPLLVEQVKASVRWEESVLEMIACGVDTFIEIGPGNTLAGLIKKIDRKAKVYSVSDLASLEALKSNLEA
ncbi:ACP S-malonyltransferase [Anaerotalea alkaliphila]|uniref:Malonyl CoA-acyl carrier protein transacylase n=1 Tax=Anaerotalea alkaliphila TaxID=2662126 RepID=A0A7X5KNI7_9FIRM|nr:ACP S-malonyltransferase [Anaerotalea alkaliphila]NDL68069.1 ACP S-malonyltransferase [Anaerotalea alkaliphila]